MAQRERVRARIAGAGNYFVEDKNPADFITSGSKLFDLALGGGWRRRRIANVIGDKSTGKTLLCIEASANFLIKLPKGKIRYREAESAFDIPYAKALGMPIDHVDFGEPMETVEDFFDDLNAIIKGSKGPELLILDSLDALSDRDEMARDMDEGTYGTGKAKKMSQLFRRAVRQIEAKDITVIIVSQIRDNIGATFMQKKYTRSGGRALDFYASQVPVLANVGKLSKTVQNTKRATGIVIRARLEKNKVGLPFREAEFPILFGYGIDDVTSCLTWLKEIKALKEVGLSEDEIKSYSRELISGPIEEQRKETLRIHEVVARKWQEIETTIMPRRTKYGS